MHTIQVHDKSFTSFLSHEEILTRIEGVANQINADYTDKSPLFIAILNGSFMFASDLFKSLNIEAEICFIKLASYKGIKSTGQVTTSIGLDVSLKDRDVILIEDIVDTGKTLHEFLPQLFNQNPSSIRIASLLHKPDALLYPVKVDYLGFEVPNKFLVGYGLDYDGLGRNLKDIYQLKITE
jgi:hypoxanthine phosphoribosyltransferase